MGATLDLFIDTATGELIDGGSVNGGALPTLTRNDSYTLRLRLMERQINGSYNDIDLTGATLKVGIGEIEDAPSDGAFKLAVNSVTSGEIAFNATAVSVFNAVSNNVSTVSLYGGQSSGFYLLTATQPNTALSFNSDAHTLFPSSTILINTRRNPATGVFAQQTVQLIKNPVVFSDTFTTAPTNGVATLTKVNDGSATQNETYELALGNTVRGGLFSLNFGGNSTTGIAPLTSAITVQAQLSAVTAIGAGNISVQENGRQGYTIQFVGGKGLTNITTALNLDATGLDFVPLRQTTLTMNTAELADAFAEAGEDSIATTLEIELTQNSSPKTIFQGGVTIRKDLITVGQSVPGAQAQFYTKAETDALFVEDSASNVNATGRALVDSVSVTAFDYGTRSLLNSSGAQVVSYGAGLALSGVIGFYAAAVTAQPANINVVSGLINVGLIANGSTYGVLPSSPRTLTTTASIAFGTLAAHATSAGNVVVTGAAIGDIVLVGLPGVVSAGPVVQGVVFAANTVCMTAMNVSSASRTIGTADFRITVIGY